MAGSATNAAGQAFGLGDEPDRDMVLQRRTGGRIDHDTTTGRHHLPLTRRKHPIDHVALDAPKDLFSISGKNVPNGAASLAFDLGVGVDEIDSQAFRQTSSNGRLAGSHETHEHDVPGRRHRPTADAWFRTNSSIESPPNLRCAS